MDDESIGGSGRDLIPPDKRRVVRTPWRSNFPAVGSFIGIFVLVDSVLYGSMTLATQDDIPPGAAPVPVRYARIIE